MCVIDKQIVQRIWMCSRDILHCDNSHWYIQLACYWDSILSGGHSTAAVDSKAISNACW